MSLNWFISCDTQTTVGCWQWETGYEEKGNSLFYLCNFYVNLKAQSGKTGENKGGSLQTTQLHTQSHSSFAPSPTLATSASFWTQNIVVAYHHRLGWACLLSRAWVLYCKENIWYCELPSWEGVFTVPDRESHNREGSFKHCLARNSTELSEDAAQLRYKI